MVNRRQGVGERVAQGVDRRPRMWYDDDTARNGSSRGTQVRRDGISR